MPRAATCSARDEPRPVALEGGHDEPERGHDLAAAADRHRDGAGAEAHLLRVVA